MIYCSTHCKLNTRFSRNSLYLNPPPIYFMNTRIECVNECAVLGIHISNDFSDKNVFHTAHKFNMKCNKLRYDFKLLPSDVKS